MCTSHERVHGDLMIDASMQISFFCKSFLRIFTIDESTEVGKLNDWF